MPIQDSFTAEEKTVRVAVVKNILDANSRIAQENRKIFDRHGLTVINLMSSPGAGKTTLLERWGATSAAASR